MSLRHLEQEKKWRKNVEEENEKILQLEQQIGAMKEAHEVELRQQVCYYQYIVQLQVA